MNETQMAKKSQELADYLTRHRAYLVVGVTRITTWGDRHGKINLGKAAGAKGDNSRAARPVERAVTLGLIAEHPATLGRGNGLSYTATRFGERVVALLDSMRHEEA